MNLIVNKQKAEKKWKPILDVLQINESDKREWIAEYAEMHQLSMNENVSYSNLGNLNGMGAVVAPQPGAYPGQVWGADGGAQGSGDIAQNLLPVSMKIAAQTIGLDLVAVKPASSPRIELLFVDFKYDNNDGVAGGNQDRPLLFKLNTSLLATDLEAELKVVINAAAVRDRIGGLTERVFLKLSGGTLGGVYYSAGTAEGTGVDSITTEPAAGKQGWLEFLGFSRIDGYPMFRAYRQNTAPNVNESFQDALNTFPQDQTTSVVEYLNDVTVMNAADYSGMTISGVTIELISTMEDQIPGFVAGWTGEKQAQTGMQREIDEKTYPGVIGPDVFTKSIEVGDIEISSALKRTQIEDIKASTGMDIVQKLESVLVNELTQTISKQIVAKIRDLAAQNRSSYTAPKDANGTSKFDFDVDTYIGATGFGPAPGGETTHSVQRKLIAKINNASNYIATEGRVGPAQYLVTNGNLASVIQDVAGYTINPTGAGKINTNGQMYPMGTINNITIYVDPYQGWDDNRIFLGRKNSVDQPGLVFVPYLMAQSISLISEATWAPRMLIRSRYAIADIGFFPEKQFMELQVTDTRGVLI
jgi:Major capsid protein Gp23